MRRLAVIVLWTAGAGIISLTAGASAFGIISFALSDPGKHPATWAGWDILFYLLMVAPPAIACPVAIYQGIRQKLPGTQAANNSKHPDSPNAKCK